MHRLNACWALLVALVLCCASARAELGEVWRSSAYAETDYQGHPVPRRTGHTMVAFKGMLWVIGGFDNSQRDDVWYSSDGATWVQAPAGPRFTPRSGHTCVVLNDRMWIIGGYDGTRRNDVWWTEDGIEWHEAVGVTDRFSPRSYHTSAAFNGRMWVICGHDGTAQTSDVWSSANGSDWTMEAAQTALGARSAHATTVYQGRLWTIGGFVGLKMSREAFSSDDGIIWQVEPTPSEMNMRAYHTALEFEGGLWVLPGDLAAPDVWVLRPSTGWRRTAVGAQTPAVWNGAAAVLPGFMVVVGGAGGAFATPSGEAWASHDGESWRRLTARDRVLPTAEDFIPRDGHSMVSFRDRVWVIGGARLRSRSDCSNDIWSTTDGRHWTRNPDRAPFTPRRDHVALVFGDRLWVIGGDSDYLLLNDVWSTADGYEWRLETAAAEFAPRADHTVVEHEGKMWLIGGRTPQTGFEGIADVWSSPDGVHWEQATADASFPERNNHVCASLNGRLWVAGGLHGYVLWDCWSSADGVTWQEETSNGNYSWMYGIRTAAASLTHDGKWYVTGGTGSSSAAVNRHVLWTSDGVNWEYSPVPLDIPRYEHAMTFHEGRIWINSGIGGEDSTWASPDGKVWELLSTTYSASTLSGVMAGASIGDVAFIGSTQGQYSLDGEVWYPASPSIAEAVTSGRACALHDGRLWVVGGSGVTVSRYSSDGIHWEAGGVHDAVPPRSDHVLLSHDGKLVLIGGGDGVGTESAYRSDVWVSDTGTTWTQATAAADFRPRAGMAGASLDGKMWIIGGKGPTTDGVTTTAEVWSSTDGTSWTLETASPGFAPRHLHSLTEFKGRLWLIGGNSGEAGAPFLKDVWSSADGVHWRLECTNPSFEDSTYHAAFVLHDELYVRTGSALWRSADGRSWVRVQPRLTPEEFPLRRSNFASLETDDSITILGGLKWQGSSQPTQLAGVSGAATTSDLVNWTVSPLEPSTLLRYGSATVRHHGRTYLIGGTNGIKASADVWSSDNGTTWTQVTADGGFPPRAELGAVSFHDKLWIVGGRASSGSTTATDDPAATAEVWSSADGTSWTLEVTEAPFGARSGLALTVHGDRMWLVGGRRSDNALMNDVWSSDNGTSWTLEVASAPFDPRRGHDMISAYGELWLSGGHARPMPWTSTTPSELVYFADVWASADGINWRCVTPRAPWAGREGHRMYARDGGLWIVGGRDWRGDHADAWFSAGQGGVAADAPDAVEFGKRPAGGNAVTVGVPIRNRFPQASDSLNILGAAIETDDAGAFGVNGTSLPGAILPGAHGDVGVTFAPDDIGAFAARLVVTTDDPSTPILRVDLTGTGVDPNLKSGVVAW